MYSVHCEASYMYIDLTIELEKNVGMYTALYMHNPYSLWGYSYFYRSSLSTVPPLHSYAHPSPFVSLCSTSIVEVSLSSNIFWTLRI